MTEPADPRTIRDLLAKYGRHLHPCAAEPFYWAPKDGQCEPPPCSCGFDAALAALDAVISPPADALVAKLLDYISVQIDGLSRSSRRDTTDGALRAFRATYSKIIELAAVVSPSDATTETYEPISRVMIERMARGFLGAGQEWADRDEDDEALEIRAARDLAREIVGGEPVFRRVRDENETTK